MYRIAIFTGMICFLASLLSLLPVWFISTRDQSLVPQGFGLGTIMRLFICGGAYLFATKFAAFSGLVFAGWLMGWYLFFLIIEVMMLSLYLKKLPVQAFDLQPAGENQA